MKKNLFAVVFNSVAFAALCSVATLAQAQNVVVGDVAAGQSKAAMCIGCHGIVGYQSSFPEIHKVPKISGQSAEYVAAALKAYQKGERKHPTMKGIAAPLTEQDMADLGAFYASHVEGTAPEALSKTPSTEVKALLDKGNCVSCHGANLSKPLAGTYPKIAGQHADYLYVALKSYTVDGNSYIGRSNAIMGGIARQFSAQELKALAKYVGSLDTELSVKPQPRFRAQH